ncbi:MAG TPA: winged helix-turn-helix domain-containing protein [Candidatus Saccharimonadia bacterium]|jgi:DNA-binding transcriptional ArsR family regulator|nr:winged helix-turn-helix domain-containing protein [Candidatus Saccharimonadia bacterium]
MLSIKDLDINSPQLDSVFDALANPKRRGMFNTLSFRPATVADLAAEHNLSLPSIHRHIRVLEEAGLVQRKKVGRTNFVALKRASLRTAQAWLMQYRSDWGTDEETLENYINNARESK